MASFYVSNLVFSFSSPLFISGHVVDCGVDPWVVAEDGADDWQRLAVPEDRRDERTEKQKQTVQLRQETQQSEHIPSNNNHDETKEIKCSSHDF